MQSLGIREWPLNATLAFMATWKIQEVGPLAPPRMQDIEVASSRTYETSETQAKPTVALPKFRVDNIFALVLLLPYNL